MNDKMSDNEGIVDVLIAIDLETILDKYGGTNSNPDKPIQITQPDLIYMIAKQDNSVSGQAGNELTIAMKTSDTNRGGIRWRETSLSLNSDSGAILYKFTHSSGENLMSTPKLFVNTFKAPQPNQENPTSPKTKEIQSHFWYSTVLNLGRATYSLQFLVVDNQGNTGYFYWDSVITITNK